MEEVNAHFFGDVHGVGFRATTLRLAQKLQLKGYVSNNADGSVEICAQGPRKKIDEFLKQLQQIFSKYITRSSIDFVKSTKDYSDFTVVR